MECSSHHSSASVPELSNARNMEEVYWTVFQFMERLFRSLITEGVKGVSESGWYALSSFRIFCMIEVGRRRNGQGWDLSSILYLSMAQMMVKKDIHTSVPLTQVLTQLLANLQAVKMGLLNKLIKCTTSRLHGRELGEHLDAVDKGDPRDHREIA